MSPECQSWRRCNMSFAEISGENRSRSWLSTTCRTSSFCRWHHLDKLLVVHLPVSVIVGFPDHLVYLLVREVLSQVLHHQLQLLLADLAVTVLVEHLGGRPEGLEGLLTILIVSFWSDWSDWSLIAGLTSITRNDHWHHSAARLHVHSAIIDPQSGHTHSRSHLATLLHIC